MLIETPKHPLYPEIGYVYISPEVYLVPTIGLEINPLTPHHKDRYYENFKEIFECIKVIFLLLHLYLKLYCHFEDIPKIVIFISIPLIITLE